MYLEFPAKLSTEHLLPTLGFLIACFGLLGTLAVLFLAVRRSRISSTSSACFRCCCRGCICCTSTEEHLIYEGTSTPSYPTTEEPDTLSQQDTPQQDTPNEGSPGGSECIIAEDNENTIVSVVAQSSTTTGKSSTNEVDVVSINDRDEENPKTSPSSSPVGQSRSLTSSEQSIPNVLTPSYGFPIRQIEDPPGHDLLEGLSVTAPDVPIIGKPQITRRYGNWEMSTPVNSEHGSDSSQNNSPNRSFDEKKGAEQLMAAVTSLVLNVELQTKRLKSLVIETDVWDNQKEEDTKSSTMVSETSTEYFTPCGSPGCANGANCRCNSKASKDNRPVTISNETADNLDITLTEEEDEKTEVSISEDDGNREQSLQNKAAFEKKEQETTEVDEIGSDEIARELSPQKSENDLDKSTELKEELYEHEESPQKTIKTANINDRDER